MVAEISRSFRVIKRTKIKAQSAKILFFDKVVCPLVRSQKIYALVQRLTSTICLNKLHIIQYFINIDAFCTVPVFKM